MLRRLCAPGGLILVHFGLNVIGDGYGCDDQDHAYDNLQFDEGEARLRAPGFVEVPSSILVAY
jgi:hypothetical protein